MPSNKMNFLNRLKAEPEIVRLIAEAISDFETYQARLILLWDELHPEEAIHRLESEIQSAPGTKARDQLRAKISILNSTGTVHAQAAATNEAWNGFEPVKVSLVTLCQKAITLVEGYLEHTVAREKALFDEFGFEPSATAISTAVRSLIADLKTELGVATSYTKNQRHMLPGLCEERVIQFFTT